MERIKLNLIPSGVAPIVHLSQYDDGRKFGIDLFEGESVYVLDGTETLTVNSRKPDGHVVVLTVTNTGTSSLDVDTVEQLTAVHGVSYAKLQIVKDSVTIATLPFLIDVSRDPLENGDPSESFVQNLRTQIADGVAEEVATQYDSSNVIFDNEPTDNHGTGYTVTSEGIKTAIDNAFDYDNTASGSLVHITDGADNIPLKSCEVTINPDLSGKTECNLVVTPDNLAPLFNADNNFRGRVNFNQLFTASSSGTYDSILTTFDSATGTLHSSGTTASTYYFFVTGTEHKIPITSGHKYFVHIDDTRTVRYAVYDGGTNRNIIDKIGVTIINSTYNGWLSLVSLNNTVGSSVDITCKPIIIDLTQLFGETIADYIYNLEQSEAGAGIALFKSIYPNDYYAYNSGTNELVGARNGTTYNIPFGQTITEGGTLDVINGELTVGGVTTQITPVQPKTISGINNIYNDCGDVEVEYYTYKSNDILEFIDSEIGKKNGTNIPIEENSQDSIKTYVDNGLSGKVDEGDCVPFALDYPSSITGLVKYANGCYYNPQTNEVHINIVIYSNENNIPNNNGVIATIPSEYRPSAERVVASFSEILDENNALHFEAIQPIGTNGEIKLHNFVYSGLINTICMNFVYYK